MKSIYSLRIFILSALSCGWIGVGLNRLLGQEQTEESLGMAFWLVTPLITVVLLKLSKKESWKTMGLHPVGDHNLIGYALAFFIFPVITFVVVGLGYVTGVVSLESFDGTAYLSLFIVSLLPQFIKNIFEEFVWRGYLTSQLITMRVSDTALYLISGMVWALWHLPYYLQFLPAETMHDVLPVSPGIFACVALLTMLAWTVMFVELFRLTRSIWPLVLMHMMEDATLNHLVLDHHIRIQSGYEIWFSPILGLVTSLLYLMVGFSIRSYRKKSNF